MYVYSKTMGYLVTVKDRADEIEAMPVKSPANVAEYERLREIQVRTTLNKQQLD